MSINWKKVIGVSAAVLGTAFVAASVVSKKKKPDTVYENEPEQKNPLEGKKVVFIENGTVVEEGPSAQVFENPRQERTSAFLRTILQHEKE